MQHEAVLKLKPRPLRLVYLVKTATDLTNAVTLYSHLWGGFSNAIFPVLNNTDQSTLLQHVIYSINPDYIFLPEEDLPDNCVEILDQFPSRYLKLSSERIEDIVSINNHLLGLPVETLNSFSRREFPHIITVLNYVYQKPLSDSNIHLLLDSSLFNTEIFLQFGRPSNRYQEYLRNHLNAQLISIPSTENLLKTCLLTAIGFFTSPISLTKSEITHTQFSWNWQVQNHKKVCNLFLFESGEINIAASFWNSRRLDIGYSNKLILPKENFVESLKECISILSSFFPSMRELIIYATLSLDDATELANNIHAVFNELERDIFVRVFYEDSGFVFHPGGVYSSKPIITTREISLLDKSIRFSPVVPSGYENSDCVFGYDAEIEFSSGKSFSAPFMQTSAVLLSNRIEQVEYSENSTSSLSKDWQQRKTQPIRPAAKGVTGLAVSNEECCIYIPESKEIIAKWLKNAGFLFQLNDHTRYAQGFIKRFGGFAKTSRLINSGGTKIFVALGSDRAKQCGFKYSQIVEFLKSSFNLDKGEARKIVDQNLPELLEAGLLYRGHPLKCPSCGLHDWYKLEKVNEFVECTGCVENFQLQNLCSLEFAYKPNELAARFLNSDGQAILATAVFLSGLASSGHIQLGGDLLRLGDKQSFAEIDLFVLVGDILILTECKSCRIVDDEIANEIINHLERVVKTASLVSAKAVVLGVVTASVNCDLHTLVTTVAQTAAERGIGVHLLLNDKFYLGGQKGDEVTEPWRLHIDALLVEEDVLPHHANVSVGEAIGEYSWQEGDRLFSQNLLEGWKQQLCL